MIIGTLDTAVQRGRPRPRPWRRLGAAIVAAVAIAVGALVVLVESKPADLTSVRPADAATLATAPADVSLGFSANPSPQQFHLTVAAPGGASVASGPSRVDGRRIVVPVRIDRRGTYLVAYHVVTADGRELSGQSRFTVTADSPVVGPPAAPDPLDHAAHAVDGFGLVLLTVDVALTAVLAVFMVRRRRSR